MVLEWPAASRQFHLKAGVRLRLAKKATSSGPWHLEEELGRLVLLRYSRAEVSRASRLWMTRDLMF
jgi:hypothetical protein